MTCTPLALENLGVKQAELLVLTQVREHLGDIRSLQKIGFQVRVHVYRLPVDDGEALNKDQDSVEYKEFKELIADRAVPAFQLRAQHELEVTEKSKMGQTPEEMAVIYNKNMRENYVYPKGGYTKVELTNPVNQKVYTGECHFGINDIFNRKYASIRAFGKMFSKMLNDCSMGRKRGKQAVNGWVD